MPKKLRLGWFTFTCCEDSSIVFVELLNDHYFEWKEKIDFAHVKMLKSKNDMSNLDVAFVEGAISTDQEEKELKEIRANCKKLIAIGACAVTGLPSAQRNNFDEDTKKEIKPFLKSYGLWEKVKKLDEIVKVDVTVPGCPMDANLFLKTIEATFKEFGID
jgi:coenzyme F420-reducing hydrogenase gamma subunit